jgi:ferredoxin
MSKKAFVDQDLCIGCGICVGNLPKVFRMNDDNKAECYDPTAATEDEIQSDAIDACPVSCICWE